MKKGMIILLFLGFAGFLIWLFGLRRTGMKSQSLQSVLKIIEKTGLGMMWSNKTIRNIMAMAWHETGGFTSKIFLENNNLFGMKMPRIRPTYAKGAKNGYADYENIVDSVYDLKAWFDYNKINPNNFEDLGQYVNILKYFKYFEDTKENYEKGMFNAMKKLGV